MSVLDKLARVEKLLVTKQRGELLPISPDDLNDDWIKAVSTMSQSDKDALLENALKHQPGRHPQSRHAGSKGSSELGSTAAPSSAVGHDYVDAKAVEYIDGNEGYITDVMRNAELLGKATGDSERAGQLIFNWQQSAGDKNPTSLGLQQAAADEFDVGMSGHHKSKAKALQDNPDFQRTKEDGKKFLRATYDNTQEELKAAGIGKVVLYRGVSYLGAEAGVAKELSSGDTLKYSSNALESWSANPGRAKMFAEQRAGVGVVLQVEVPASKVISTQRTGIGYANDSEFVLLGGTGDQARVTYVSQK